MEIFLDPSSFLQSLLQLGTLPFYLAMWYIFIKGGWVIFLLTFLIGGWNLWVYYIQGKYAASIKHVLLAIDVPKESEQSPKVAEYIFSQIAGIERKGNFVERNFHGYSEPSVSLEIISLEGYIQFLIRTPEKFRDVIEAAIYAQYPDAEITEVKDYAKNIPSEFPHERYHLWGTELVLTNKDFYPIRTYPEFEHSLSQELKDPMAALLEIMSRLQKGEYLGLQIIITPTMAKEWRKQAKEYVMKLIGKETGKKPGKDLFWLPRMTTHGLVESLTATLIEPTPWGETAKKENNDQKGFSLMQYLSPGERNRVEAIENKLSKIVFETKFRMIYWGKRNVFHKGRGVNAVIGAIKQFNTGDLNGFKPDKKTKTKVDYWLVKKRVAWRQRKIARNYRYRSNWRGAKSYMLNIEELATLFHFPVLTVKAPLVQKTVLKKAEPPTGLPVAEEEFSFERDFLSKESGKVEANLIEKKRMPPEDLPVE